MSVASLKYVLYFFNHCFKVFISAFMHFISYYISSNLRCSCRKLQSDSKISAAQLGIVAFPHSFYVKVMRNISVSADLFDLLSSDSGGRPIFCTFREAALPPSSRNEVRNENAVCFEVSSEIRTSPSWQPWCYKPDIDLSVCACALDAATFASVVEQSRMHVGARLCVIDGGSLQIYWSQKTLA